MNLKNLISCLVLGLISFNISGWGVLTWNQIIEENSLIKCPEGWSKHIDTCEHCDCYKTSQGKVLLCECKKNNAFL